MKKKKNKQKLKHIPILDEDAEIAEEFHKMNLTETNKPDNIFDDEEQKISKGNSDKGVRFNNNYNRGEIERLRDNNYYRKIDV